MVALMAGRIKSSYRSDSDSIQASARCCASPLLSLPLVFPVSLALSPS